MNTLTWIAGRYFSHKGRQRFLPLMTVVSISGVALGTMALVVVLSVMRGFGGEIQKRFMGFNSHITITRTSDAKALSAEEIQAYLPKDSAVIPFVNGEAIAQTQSMGEMIATGVNVRGVLPEAPEAFSSSVNFYFPEGSARFAELNKSSGSASGVILGGEILSQLTVHPDFEDEIDLVAPLAIVGPTGELEPNIRTYRLVGSFKSGVFEYDSKFAFISLPEARKLLGAQAQEGYYVALKDPHSASKIAYGLKDRIGQAFRIESWDVQNKKLFAALKLERIAMSAILVLIILIASFSIVGILMMVVSTKRKDIAILRAQGMSAPSIKRVFLIYGILIGAIGSLTGGILGTALCAALWHWPIRLPASYYLDTLPVEWSLWSTVVFVACGILIAALASLYPVSQTTAEKPVVTLRYE